MDIRRLAAPLRICFGLLPIVAVGCQFLIHLRLGLDVVNFFSYFTNLANLLAAVTLLIGARMPLKAGERTGFDVLRAMAAVSMVVVGVVFAVLLRNADLGSLQPWVNTVVHYVMPCVIVVDWILWPPQYPLRFRELLLCQIAPAAYLTYVLIRGAWIGWYPYPFFNPAVVGGYGNVAIYAIGIAGVFLLGGMVLFWGSKAPAEHIARQLNPEFRAERQLPDGQTHRGKTPGAHTNIRCTLYPIPHDGVSER